jgi:hypothetical protein
MSKRAQGLLLVMTTWPVLLIGVLLVFTAPANVPEHCVSSDDRLRIRTLALEGIDKAFREHVEHLFDVWTKDTSEQPRRATSGMAVGISAYRRARANALAWEPQICKE